MSHGWSQWWHRSEIRRDRECVDSAVVIHWEMLERIRGYAEHGVCNLLRNRGVDSPDLLVCRFIQVTDETAIEANMFGSHAAFVFLQPQCLGLHGGCRFLVEVKSHPRVVACCTDRHVNLHVVAGLQQPSRSIQYRLARAQEAKPSASWFPGLIVFKLELAVSYPQPIYYGCQCRLFHCTDVTYRSMSWSRRDGSFTFWWAAIIS